jgi:hypothetical protein
VDILTLPLQIRSHSELNAKSAPPGCMCAKIAPTTSLACLTTAKFQIQNISPTAKHATSAKNSLSSANLQPKDPPTTNSITFLRIKFLEVREKFLTQRGKEGKRQRTSWLIKHKGTKKQRLQKEYKLLNLVYQFKPFHCQGNCSIKKFYGNFLETIAKVPQGGNIFEAHA